MVHVTIVSRRGNFMLGFLGVVYAVAALVLLAWHLAQTWGAAGMIDWLIQTVLIVTFFSGVWFVLIAAKNLGYRRAKAAQDARGHSKPATI